LVEHMAGQVSKIEDRMENMMSNSVNIERLQKDMEKVLSDIEKLKDKQRSFANGTR
jgi:chaperonin cofactor prefoldin